MDSLPAIKGSALHDQSSLRVFAPPPVRLLAKVRRKYSQGWNCLKENVGGNHQSPIGFGPESLDKVTRDVRMRRRFSLTRSGRFLAAPAANTSTIAM